MELKEKILKLIYPPKCTFCRKILTDEESGICRKCAESIRFLSRKEGSQVFPWIDVCVSPLYYEGDVKESLHRFKFSSLTAYAGTYADLILAAAGDVISSCSVITRVPLSRKRLRKRGYDQAELIARELSARSGIDCVPLLKKIRNVRPQSRTGNFEKRRANIKDAYIAINAETIAGRKILLVDDIVTTGSTLSECGGVLKRAGALAVYAAAAARAKD